jgi:uncharacterized phage protein (TIGR01671 family)
MDIRKWIDKYSIDCRLKYNSLSTQENYISQVKQFLYYFVGEIEPKSIPNDSIKLWLLQAKTINTRKHRLCALSSFYSLTVNMPDKIHRIPYPKSDKKLPIVLSQDEVQKMFWFDLMWGSLHNKGTGWIGMLPIEQKERKEIKSFTQSDDRFAIDPTNCEIMKFTGLNDQKGIEIYEGDIIQYSKHEGYLMDSFKAEIRFIESYACFGYLKLGLNEYGFDHVIIHPFSEHDEFGIDVLPYFEVIGNIYENSDLVNGDV